MSKFDLNTTEKTTENFVSETGEYIIPVSWEVYSTVIVKGVANLGEAIKAVRDNLDDIPLSRNPEYIDSSYKVDADSDEDFMNAQQYNSRGVLMDMSDGQTDFVVLD